MTTKKQSNKSREEIAIDMVCGVTAALTYSDEEIYSTISKEDADEFIQLRKEVQEEISLKDTRFKIGYGIDDEEFSLAAEDEVPYE